MEDGQEGWLLNTIQYNLTILIHIQASPGNLSDVEDLLFGSVDILTSPIVAALSLQVKASVQTIGMAFTDSSEREMGVAEFVDNEVPHIPILYYTHAPTSDFPPHCSSSATSKALSFSRASRKSSSQPRVTPRRQNSKSSRAS